MALEKEKVYTVYQDIVPIIYENDVPSTAVINVKGHQIFFDLREAKGTRVVDILQTLTTQKA